MIETLKKLYLGGGGEMGTFWCKIRQLIFAPCTTSENQKLPPEDQDWRSMVEGFWIFCGIQRIVGWGQRGIIFEDGRIGGFFFEIGLVKGETCWLFFSTDLRIFYLMLKIDWNCWNYSSNGGKCSFFWLWVHQLMKIWTRKIR